MKLCSTAKTNRANSMGLKPSPRQSSGQKRRSGRRHQRQHGQHKADAADGDQHLQIAVMAVADRVHPAAADIIVQRRLAAGVGEGAEARAQQGWSAI